MVIFFTLICSSGIENPELSKAIAKKIGLLNAKVARALAGKHAAVTLDSQMNDVSHSNSLFYSPIILLSAFRFLIL